MDAAIFWDRAAPRYAKSRIKNGTAYNQTIDQVRTYLSAGDHVLELGCGTGSTALLLADAAARITATDVSQGMIDIARSKAAAQGVTNVEFVQSGMAEAKIATETYDAAMAFNLLHLIEDLPGALSNVHSSLKPGGLFLSKTPCLGDMGFYLKPLVLVMQFFGKAPFVGFPTRAVLEAAITDAGFEIVETCTFHKSPKTRFIAARKV